jgi:hypothetical protein
MAGMRQLDPAVETLIGAGDDVLPTPIPLIDPPKATTATITPEVMGTQWVTITDAGDQVQVRDYLPHRAIRALIKAQKAGKDDPSLVFDAVDDLLAKVLVDPVAFNDFCDAPENRVDTQKFFAMFTKIVDHFAAPDGAVGKAGRS